MLVDERDLWPDRKFVITNLIVSTKFLKAHPDVVKKLVEAQVAANEFVNTNPDEAQQAISDHIGKITGKPLDLKLIKQAWPTLEFTDDPIASSLKTGAGPRRRGRADPAGRPERPLRPDVPQRGAQGAGQAEVRPAVTSTTTTAAQRDRLRSRCSRRDQGVRPRGRAPSLALDGVSLDVAPGEFVCLVGASGCGKSTLLNLVAGLDRPSAGQIDVGAGAHRR